MFKTSKVLFIISIIFSIITAIALPQLENNKKLYTVQSISISAPTRTLEVGYYTELGITITPSTARVSSDQISWSSSNSYVARVSYGRVSAYNPGTTTITATTPNGKKASCKFTVTAKIKSISLNYTSHSIAKGDSFTLVPTITPSNATSKNITWSSSNKNVATVSTNGVVTGISGGNATITATTNNNLYASCSVTVSNNATTYSISYSLNGGTNNSSNPTSYTKLDMISLGQPTRIGYTFKGWTGSNGSIPQTYVSIPKGSSGNKNYIANWTANSYNISYVLNEGNFGSYHPTTLTYDTPSTISNPTKAYATFTGWTISGMDSITHTYGSNTTTSSSILSTKEKNYKNLRSTNGTVTFTANWSYTNYSIFYNLKGGTNTSSNPSEYTYYDSIILGVPQKNGYKFIGWTGSNGTTPQTNVSISKYSTGNKSYTANWELATYSITYNLNGGNVSGTNPTSYTINTNLINIINPTKTGYEFTGWTGSNGTTKQINLILPKGSYGDKAYTANWKPIQYTISYNLNGGSNNSWNYSSYTTENSKTIYSPSRNGYSFVGWTGSNGDIPQTSITIAKGSTGNKTFTANWEIITYNITYELKNGTINGSNPTKYTIETDDIIFTNPTRDYYTFDYWSDSYCYNSSNKEYGIKKGTYGNKTIIAHWTPINYSIEYNLDGGVVSGSNKSSYNIETNTFTLINPTKNGFEFVGWSGTGLTGNNNKNVQIVKGGYGNRQYKANWQAKQFTLKFVTNCASQLDAVTIDCGSELVLPKPVWNGKSLEGWYKDEGLTIRFDSLTMPAENLTLYAKWISYDIIISPNELTAISINTELTPDGIGATAVDTDGDTFDLTLTTSGTFAVGETVVIRLNTTGKYSTAKQKTYEVKVYGMPEVSYNTTKDYINLTDELVSELFNAVGTDTFGGNTTNTLYIKEARYSAGDKVTIVIKFIDVAGNEKIVEIPDIKVYGEPTISCDTEKIKVQEKNEYSAENINAKAYDSFGKELPITIENVTTIDTGFVNGDTYSYYTSKTQNIKTFTAYNTEKYTLYHKNSSSSYNYGTYVRIYCETTNTTITTLYSSSTSYKSYSFDVTAGYLYSIRTERYSYSATFYMYLRSSSDVIDYSVINFVGKVITLKLTATDIYGNTHAKNVDLKVCGTPTISEPTKILFKDIETISVETLGVIARDSFNDEINNINLELIEGKFESSATLKYLITATDSVGNQSQKTISGIKIYGKPVITYNTDKAGIKITDMINASLFNATAKDSFNTFLTVETQIYSGNFEVGNYIKIKFKATDCVGNVTEIITDNIGIYLLDDITLTYNQYLSDYIKLTSKGEEFNAIARDSFGNKIDIEVVATNGTLAGGNVISLKLVATDKAGNSKESQIINNVRVYDIPNITCGLTRDYLYVNDDNIELYIVAKDSFGDEIVPSITIKSGEKTVGSKITYLVTAIDKAGNQKQSEYSFVIIGDNQVYVTFNVDGGSSFDKVYQAISINENYSIDVPTKTDYIFMGWFDDSGTQYTDRLGNSIKQFTTKGEYILVAHWQLKYLLSYDLNGGQFDGSYPTSYTLEDEFTLISPVKTGYNFIGWTGSNGDTPQINVTITFGSVGDKSYIANWSIIEYSISYTLNGGVVTGINPNKYTIESDSITLINPTKIGYTFVGWTGSNGNTAQMEIIIPSGSIGDKNYVANWTPIEYMLAYELNGGTISNTNPTLYTIESNNISINNPTKDYYNFIGWTGSNGDVPQKNLVITKGSYGNKIYTANWLPINYTISYNLDGGLNEMNNPTSYNIETETFSLLEPTKTGYEFIGWTGSNGVEPEIKVFIFKGMVGNKEYTANWKTISYSITYSLNGGIIEGSNPINYTVESNTITLINPTRLGYTFVGWTGSNGETPQIEVSMVKGTIGNKTYISNWEAIEYVISYNLFGGSFDEEYPTKYTIESETFSLLEPTKTGYEFIGWTSSNGVEPQIEISIPKGTIGDKEYTANWLINTYSISYNLNYGNIEGINPTEYTIESDITLINPTRTGYTFVGWTENTASTTEMIVRLRKSTGNKSYTANWEILTYTILYNLNNGSTDCENPNQYTIESDNITLIIPSRTGYEFVGWTGSNGTEPQLEVTIQKGTTGDKKFIANWGIITYLIEYNLNGGTDEGMNPKSYTIESGKTILINPRKNGYTFTGWTGSSGTTPQTSVTISKGSYGNKSYTANWVPIEYQIYYNLNGGIIDGTNPSQYTIETDNITLINPTKIGYIFVGWTGSNSTTKQMTVTLYTGSTGNKSYTANWNIVNYQITYVLNGGINSLNNPTSYNIESDDIIFEKAFFTDEQVSRWYTDINFENQITKVKKGSVGNLVLYARAGYDDSEIYTIEDNSIVNVNNIFIKENGITSITIPNYIKIIKEESFLNCNTLTSIIIPNNVTKIEQAAFQGCSSLESMEIPFVGEYRRLDETAHTTPFGYIFGDSYFANSTKIEQRYYGSAVGLSRNVNYYIPNSLKYIKINDYKITYGAFSNCSYLEDVEFGDGVDKIGDDAFYGCSSLESIKIPKSVTIIGRCAFYGCSSLTTIIIPYSVIRIGHYAFEGCSGLTIYCEIASELNGWVSTWNNSNCPVFWYSENKPTKTGNYWHYIDGKAKEW